MFNSIHLQHFFSFQDSIIPCNPGVNLFIGINGSGKSNLLKALRLVQEAASGGDLRKLINDQWGGFNNIYYQGSDSSVVYLTFEINHVVASEFGFPFASPIFYRLGIHRVEKTTSYYLSERLYEQNPDENIYLDFERGNGKIQETKWGRKLSGEAPGEIIHYSKNTFDGQEAVLGKIYDSDRYQAVNVIRLLLKDVAVYRAFS
jgi:predicted ATPase